MKSKLYPKEIKWEDWKDRPIAHLPISTYLPVFDDEEEDSLCVEFYKAEDVRHKREFIEEFLYEYQQVLKHEEFQYEDFPQALTGPDYLAWTYWIEVELEKGNRIPYEEFVAIVRNKEENEA